MNRRILIFIFFSLSVFISNARFEPDTLRRDGYYLGQNKGDDYWHATFFGSNGSYADSIGNGALPVFHAMKSADKYLGYRITYEGNKILIEIYCKDLPMGMWCEASSMKGEVIGLDIHITSAKNGKKKWQTVDQILTFIPY